MQFYGKKDKIMVKIPKEVKKETQEAFMLRNLGFKGGCNSCF